MSDGFTFTIIVTLNAEDYAAEREIVDDDGTIMEFSDRTILADAVEYASGWLLGATYEGKLK